MRLPARPERSQLGPMPPHFLPSGEFLCCAINFSRFGTYFEQKCPATARGLYGLAESAWIGRCLPKDVQRIQDRPAAEASLPRSFCSMPAMNSA